MMGKVVDMKELGDVVQDVEAVFQKHDLNRFEVKAVMMGLENRIKHNANKEATSDMLSQGWLGKIMNPLRKNAEKDEGGE